MENITFNGVFTVFIVLLVYVAAIVVLDVIEERILQKKKQAILLESAKEYGPPPILHAHIAKPQKVRSNGRKKKARKVAAVRKPRRI